MPHLKSLTPSSITIIGQKDKKKLKHIKFDPEKTYKLVKTKEKINVITEDNLQILIMADKIVLPTLQYLKMNDYLPKVKLDSGALKPIITGSNVMAPGIFKFKENLEITDNIVAITIDNEIVGVGICNMKCSEVTGDTRGVVIEIWLRKGDIVDVYRF